MGAARVSGEHEEELCREGEGAIAFADCCDELFNHAYVFGNRSVELRNTVLGTDNYVFERVNLPLQVALGFSNLNLLCGLAVLEQDGELERIWEIWPKIV